MLKKLSKSITALILVACMAFSSVTASAASVSDDSSVGGIVADIAIDKLVEVGMRVAAEACEELGEATGVEGIEKYTSFVSDWVFSSGAEAGINKVEELCVSISNQIEELEEKTLNDFSVVEDLLAQQTENTSASALATQWKNDVTTPIDNNSEKYTTKMVIDGYKDYLKSAVNYHNEQNGLPPIQTKPGEIIDTPEKALEDLISLFCEMNVQVGGSNSANEYDTFTNDNVTISFKSLIKNLSDNLYKPADGTNIKGVTVLDAAFQCAYDAYGFSHEQYEFVFNYAEKQILNLILVCMVYNEYLYQQGTFIENYDDFSNESKRADAYNSFLNYQKEFHDLLITDVKPQITNMLNSEVVVNGSQKLSLDSCMKPEDAEAVDLHINNYESSHSYSDDGHIATTSEYIYETMRFNRVMTQTNNKRNVYYILDPSQFSDSNATKAIAMDFKNDRSYSFDIHYPSADYINLTQKTMSDGANTFACSADIFGLFNTNAFRLSGSIPYSYLGYYPPDKEVSTEENANEENSTEGNYRANAYLPKGTVLIMTPEYTDPEKDSFLGTCYEHFSVIEANSQYPGTKIEPKDYSAETFQPDKDGDKYSYSVILKNTNDVYKQTATLNIPAHLNVSLSDSKGNEIIEPTEAATPSAKITSGEKITFKFKVEDGYKIESLNCIRNNSTQSTTLLFNYDDINILKKDGDYYTFTYPMPYSDSTFDFKVVPEENEYNIWTPEDLIVFSNDMNNGINPQATANLCADIDMSGYKDQFTPIGNQKYPYCGTFNGNNHKIDGLKLEDNEYCGLFGYIKSGADIKDFTVSGDVAIQRGLNPNRCAGVVAYSSGGHLKNIISNLNFNEADLISVAFCGGIVGVANNKTEIENCMYCGTLNLTNTSSDGVGGIVGCTKTGAIINNCANVGSIIINDSFLSLGGIIGTIENDEISIKNSYNYSIIEFNDSTFNDSKEKNVYINGSDVGAIIGNAYRANSSISNNYYLNVSWDKALGKNESSSINSDSVATPKTAEQFASGEVAYLLNNKVTDGTQAWYQNLDNELVTNKQIDADKYPILTNNGCDTVYRGGLSGKYTNYNNGETGTFIIKTYDELCNMAALVNSGEEIYASGNYILANDIDCTNEPEWETAIGTSSSPFKGTFDGQGFTINGLKGKYNGLFGRIQSGTVKNLNLTNVDLNCELSSPFIYGALCSMISDNSTISNCIIDGKISFDDVYYNHVTVGGICGESYSSIIENCMSFVDINVSYRKGVLTSSCSHAGICGDATNSVIKNCAYLSSISTDKKSENSGILNGSGNTIQSCYSMCKNTLDNDIATNNNSFVGNSCYLVKGENRSNCIKMSESQFASGEVAYLLNSNVTDGTQAWYQNLDNGLTPDSYPILKNNGKNTVYKVDLEDKDYSNTDASVEPTEPTTEPVTEPTEPVTDPTEPDSKVSALDKNDLRVYYRVLNDNNTVDGSNSLITYGRGEVDNDAKIITIYTYEKVSKIGILKYQGKDPVQGTMSLVGYEPLSVTSKDIIDNNPSKEPEIYVDKNGCIFIDPNSDTSKLELEYKQNDTDSVTYEPVRYKVKIKIVDFSIYKRMGSVSSEKHYEISDINEDATTDATIPTDATQPASQPDASSTTDEAKPNTNSTASQNDSVKTGNVANVMIPITLLISAFVCLYIYRLKKIK